jgi:hypothetical protein
MNREIAVPVDSQRMYTFLEDSGLAYGTPFQNLREQRCNQGMPRQAAAQVELLSPGPDMEPQNGRCYGMTSKILGSPTCLSMLTDHDIGLLRDSANLFLHHAHNLEEQSE